MSAITVSPDAFLPNLNRALRDLRGAMAFLEAPEIEDRLTHIMRRLQIAELLSSEWIIAIGGSQGAGKTTLAQLMYDLGSSWEPLDQQWLVGNEGRGECMPILLLEDEAIAAPRGYVRRLRDEAGDHRFGIIEEPVDPLEFRKAAGGHDKTCLLPVLRVPRRYLSGSGQGLLLLPGYEVEHDGNRDWQTLMRQALIGAAGCVVVTDRTRIANADSVRILKDMYARQFAGVQPIVVISKSEEIVSDPGKQQELRSVAADVFEIPANQVDRLVIFTGTDPEYIARWRDALGSLLRNVSAGSGIARNQQFKLLHDLLRKELSLVLSDIRLQVTSKRGQDEPASDIVHDILDTFDAAADGLRADYAKKVKSRLDEQLTAATDALDDKLASDFEGLVNKLCNLFETHTEGRQRLNNAVLEAWGDPSAVERARAMAMAELTASKLGRAAGIINASSNHKDLHVRLGYLDSNQKVVEWREPSAQTLTNLQALFFPERDDQGTAERTDKELRATVKLLPALGLEFARVRLEYHHLAPAVNVEVERDELAAVAERVGGGLTSAAKAAARLSADVLAGYQPSKQKEDAAPSQEGGADSTQGKTPAKANAKPAESDKDTVSQPKITMARGIAVGLALDGADGTINSIPALMSAVGITGTPALVVTGVVVVGVLSVLVMQEIRRHDTRVAAGAQAALARIRDHHLAVACGEFDEIIRYLRDKLEERLAVRYRTDEKMMRHDRVVKALADVSSLKLDMEDLLGVDSAVLAFAKS